MRIEKLPKIVNSNSYATLAQYLYLAGDTQGGDQAAAQAKTAKGRRTATSTSQLQQFNQLGQQLQTAIKQLNKQHSRPRPGGSDGGATGGSTPAPTRSTASARAA